MNIVLNGETRSLRPETQLAQLLQELELAEKRLAVEINREIIPRSRYHLTALKNGDQVEIVQAIGGG